MAAVVMRVETAETPDATRLASAARVIEIVAALVTFAARRAKAVEATLIEATDAARVCIVAITAARS